MTLVKPDPWAWTPTRIAPAFRSIAAKCVFLAPLWDAAKPTLDLISGTETAVVAGTGTLFTDVTNGMLGLGRTGDREYRYMSVPVAGALPIDASCLFVATDPNGIDWMSAGQGPYYVEHWFGYAGGGMESYYGPNPGEAGNDYDSFWSDEIGSPVGWHATVSSAVGRNTPGPFSLDGATIVPGHYTLPDPGYPQFPGYADPVLSSNPARAVLRSGDAASRLGMFAIFNPHLTQAEANLLSGDPFGLIRTSGSSSSSTRVSRGLADSTREQICQYLLAQIDADEKPDGLLVGRQRSLPLDTTLLPAAIVYLISETAQRIVGRSIASRREAVFRVEIRVEGNPIDQRLDPLINWIVQQVMADFKLGGLAKEIEELGSQWTQSVQDTAIGAVAIDFKVTYYTKVNDLTAF